VRLVVEQLACRRSGRLLFAGLDFAVEAGRGLLVTGRNGAGKSSLLAILAGTLRPEAGRVALEGAGERPLPECLHHVGHRDGLKAALTAAENLTFAQALLGAPRLSPVEALDAVGLAHAADLPVAYLSAGQRRRVALARLLVADRPLWLLDEPTSALDVRSQEVLFELVRGHLAAGGILIAATHVPLPIQPLSELSLGRPRPQGGFEGAASVG
jgi:heme exporter protein A